MRVRDFFENISARPLEAIQGLKATTLALFGLYLISPFYIPDPTAQSSAYDNSLTFRLIFIIVFFILPALPTILGWFSAKWRTPSKRASACFYMFIGISTLTLLRILAVGFFPPIWLFYFAAGMTSAILYLHWKVKT